MRVSLVVVGVLGLITAGASTWAWTVSAGHIEVAGESADGANAARAPVAIVLGAAVHADGLPSPWLAHRLDIAADLYTSGRTEAILVSGDNRRVGYDEPTVMRNYLISKGIPSQAIALDYAGFDTYDTCVRARSDRIGWMVSWMRERPAAIKAVIDVVARRDPTLGRRETSVAEAIVWTREHRR